MPEFRAAHVLDSIIETLVDGLIVIDSTGLIRLFNPACETIFGYTATEALGQRIEMLMPAPYRHEHHGYIQHYERTGEASIIGIGREVRGQHKSGRIFPMHLSVGEISSGEIHGYVGVVRDISEDVAGRERINALQQSHLHLSRLTSMNQLGAAIAHELNQPLTALTNYAEAGRTLLAAGGNAEKLDQVMERSADQARRAAQLLSRLRQFVETGNAERILADPVSICEDSLALVRPGFQAAQIEFRTEYGNAMPRLSCDPIQIQQVLVNLIRNGCEAMQDADMRILTLACHADGDDVVFSVADTGTGLPEGFDEILFAPFQSGKDDGMGMGLSISEKIVKSHHGQISVMANMPRGTVFHVRLPQGGEPGNE